MKSLCILVSNNGYTTTFTRIAKFSNRIIKLSVSGNHPADATLPVAEWHQSEASVLHSATEAHTRLTHTTRLTALCPGLPR